MTNEKTVAVEKRQRGIIGWFFLLLFWCFNALMVYLMFFNIGNTGDLMATCEAQAAAEGLVAGTEAYDLAVSACQAGTAVGAGLVAVVGWFVWILGALVTGLFALLTRGKKVITYQ